MKKQLFTALAVVSLVLLSVQNFAQAPPLGTAADFVLFTTVGAVGNTGISQITGNVGTNSGSITGFGNVNGVMNENNGASGLCAADLLIAYNLLNSATPTFFPAPLLGNGQVFNAGVYQTPAATTLSGELILDAQNDPNAVFIILIEGPFSTAANSKVTLVNDAMACNVFWKIEGLVDMASGTTMRGTVIANNAAINMNAGCILEGRALSTAGAVNVSGVLAYTPIGCGSPVLTGPAAPDLVSAACYAIFSSDGPVTNSGITYATGDIGTNVGLTTGFNPLFVNGMIHPVPDGSTAAAASDLLNAYNYLNTLPFDIELLYPAQFGNNLVLTPHTYLLNAATSFTDTLFLDARGEADAVFVIQINGALSTSTYSKVILINGALVENVFWKVDGAVSINDYSIFKGTIVANNGALLLATGVNVDGRAFSTTGAIGITAATVTMPLGCASVSSPEIITAPENRAACEGGMVSFSVSATGTGLEYQWRKGTENLIDGLNISGSTTEMLTIDPVSFSDAASDYNVVVTGTYPPAVTSENVSLTVQALPINVFAGNDATVCAICPFTLLAASAENYSSLLWTTTGDGSFDNETELNTTYTPGITDPGTFVTLCLEVEQIAPCEGLPYVECVDLFFDLALIEPVANAGEDQDICENQKANLIGEAQNYSGVMWSGGIDGTFSAPNSLITDYSPGPGDILAGTAELCLTAELIVPNSGSDVDCLTLTIYASPAVNAGNNATIQFNETYALLEASAANYSALLWETDGDGTYDGGIDILNPTYVPGIQDIIDGEVILTLNAIGVGPCADAQHSLLLTIVSIAPTVDITSPLDGSSFNYSPVLVEGTANDEDGTIAFVEVRVNGGVWQMATGAEAWSIEVQLDPCLNAIEARATDSQGLQSELDMVANIKLNGQLLELKQGWSYVSSYIETIDPNFFTLEDYILPLNNVVIMLNDEGKVFWPSESINTLGDWNNQDGYKVKSIMDGSWLIAGDNIANQTITLKMGANIFPVLTNVDYPLPGDFDNEDVLIIFELQTARIYWPDGELYTLTELKPGFGYLGNFYKSFSITYPDYVDCELKSNTPEVQYLTNESPWQLERTASVHLISISGSAVAKLDSPEFIGAFDANGMCIGYADVREKADNYLLVIYGDEQNTGEIDGALIGENIKLVAYNGVEEAIVATYDMAMQNFDGNYALNGLSKIADFKASTSVGSISDVSELIRVYPNPANDFINISSDQNLRNIKLINLTGQVVIDNVVNGNEICLDVSKQVKGLYFVQIVTSDGLITTKRIVIE